MGKTNLSKIYKLVVVKRFHDAELDIAYDVGAHIESQQRHRVEKFLQMQLVNLIGIYNFSNSVNGKTSSRKKGKALHNKTLRKRVGVGNATRTRGKSKTKTKGKK